MNGEAVLPFMSWSENKMLDGDKTSLRVPGDVSSETDIRKKEEDAEGQGFSRGKREEKPQAPTNSLLQPPALTPQPHCLCKAPHSFSPAAFTHIAPFILFLHPELTSRLSMASPGAQLSSQTPLPSSPHPEPTLLLQSLRLCLQGQKTLHWSLIMLAI